MFLSGTTEGAKAAPAARSGGLPRGQGVPGSAAARARVEWLRCAYDVRYFVEHYCHLYDATEQAWLPFHLWRSQRCVLRLMQEERLLVVLKARQLGLSWLALAHARQTLLFGAPATVLLFSLRAAEAVELLGRLRGMYGQLPRWMQARRTVKAGDTVWEISTGSRAIAFSTKAGRSYTGTLAIVDEADFVPDLGLFLNGVKPTVDAGGKLFLISTSDKRRPVSTFKSLYRAALADVGDYRAVFLPWSARPDRDQAWHDRTQAEMFAQRGTHDDFYAEYPATPEEALAAGQLDRRLPLDWLQPCIEEGVAVKVNGQPALAGLAVFRPPESGRRYVAGVDPAEGNPNSDESALCVLDTTDWAQVAVLAGRLEPAALARAAVDVALWYGGADVMVERNNHGHAVLLALAEDGRVKLLSGHDGKAGWLSNVKGKPLLYDTVAKVVHDGECVIRDSETAVQLASIEASTLRAPEGLHDDRADALAVAVAACVFGSRAEASATVAAVDPLAGVDRDAW